jgi:hypothetical protein
MSFSITNSTNVSVLNWSVVQPQFWASIVVNSTNVLYHNYYVNATNFNPDGWNDTLSWIQNTDGADTYRSHNVTFGGLIRPITIPHHPVPPKLTRSIAGCYPVTFACLRGPDLSAY